MRRIIPLAFLFFMVMGIAQPLAFGLDVAVPALKARQSDEYSPQTAWDLGYTGKGINIAILDTGVDDGHPCLQGKFVAGADFTPPESSFTPRDGSYNPDDDHNDGHGTWVAGCAMSTGASSGEYMGTAPDAGLVDVKVIDKVGVVMVGDVIDGIQWVIEHKDEFNIRIISLSIASGSDSNGTDALSQKCEEAYKAGIVVVVSGGNDGPDNEGLSAPVSDHCIVVGGVDDMGTVDRADDVIWSGSSRGPRRSDGDDNPYDELKPDVVAPATNITSTGSYYVGQGGAGHPVYTYRTATGTSASAPLVAGVVACMLQANPKLTPDDVIQILHETAEPRGSPTYPELSEKWNREYGYGIVDAYAAVKMALAYGGQTPNEMPNGPLPVNLFSPTEIGTDSMRLTWSKYVGNDFERYEVHLSVGEGFNPSDETLEAVIEDVNTTSYKITGLKANTTYYFKLRVYDVYGNYADSNEVYATTLEAGKPQPEPNPPASQNMAPKVTILSPKNYSTVSGIVNISGTAWDDIAVKYVYLKIDGSGWYQCCGTEQWYYEWDTTNVPEGEYDIIVRAYDGSQYSDYAFLTLRVSHTTTQSIGDRIASFVVGNLGVFIVLIGILTILLAVAVRSRRKALEG